MLDNKTVRFTKVILTEADLEARRRSEEVMPWYVEKREEILSCESSRQRHILGKGIFKLFKEESCPLAIVCKHVFSTSSETIFVKQVLGNQNYDVVVEGAKSYQIDYLEITSSINSEEEHLRSVKFAKEGKVNIYGKVKKLKNKPEAKDIIVKDEAVWHSDPLSKSLARIRSILNKKCSIEYPKSTGLVILIDNIKCFYIDDDLNQLNKLVKSLEPKLKNSFSHLFFVGVNDSIVSQYKY